MIRTILLAACLALAGGCGSQGLGSSGPAKGGTQENGMLTDAGLIEAATKAIAHITKSEFAGSPKVTKRDGKECTVQFPIDWPDGETLGPDYDAEVDVDCETGEIKQVRVG